MTTYTYPLLIELVTEELPPKSLKKLEQAFSNNLYNLLKQFGILDCNCKMTSFATPRRLAVLFSQVLKRVPQKTYLKKLLPAKIGLTKNNQPSQILLKKLEKQNLGTFNEISLERKFDGTQDYLFIYQTTIEENLSVILQDSLNKTIKNLPISTVMRYQLDDGMETIKFVRPVRRLVVLLGNNIVPIKILGLDSGRETLAHRAINPNGITLNNANDYEKTMMNSGRIIVSFDLRRASILEQLQKCALKLGLTLGNENEIANLLDEVTALVEQPVVYIGEFDVDFLKIPAECLILTMRIHQKYFPLFTLDTLKLTNNFLIVSNINLDNPENIILGNQRVIQPRLIDAKFFYEQDLKIPLSHRFKKLNSVVYHHKLGSQFERVERIRSITRNLAKILGADINLADRAAMLSKSDLETNMVNEFPELQGIIGSYYAKYHGEPEEIIQALKYQYCSRYNIPVNKNSIISIILFIAEHVEKLVGIWSVGLIPNGEKDPFGLRRTALGLISAIERLTLDKLLKVSNTKSLSIKKLLLITSKTFPTKKASEKNLAEIHNFIYERYRNKLVIEFDRNIVDSVISLTPPLHQILERIRAVIAFNKSSRVIKLIIANKRIKNLIKKYNFEKKHIKKNLLIKPAEQALEKTISKLTVDITNQYNQANFLVGLNLLFQISEPLDDFFKDVMVMTSDISIRLNRLSLLTRVHNLMNQIVDISMLN